MKDPEFEQLQLHLAAMRMHCDSCYIMDPKIKESPKIDELRRILEEIDENTPERKIIIFSEWVKMLELAACVLEELGIGYVRHTGDVPQKKRREEINRFKSDPACRVFLSSDSGGVGLNLQAASVVINLDLPWNPAKLEQRIARCWRKMQKNNVSVINLVAENTIEHKMLGTLRFKQGLADVVLDDRGDAKTFELANAKGAFLSRLSELMDSPMVTANPAPDPMRLLKEKLALRHPEIQRVSARLRPDAPPAFLGVGSDPEKIRRSLKEEIANAYGETVADRQVTVLTPEEQALLKKLAEQGFITIHSDSLESVLERPEAVPPEPSDREKRLALARPPLSAAARDLKLAQVLHSGGFEAEAAEPALRAVQNAALALTTLLPGETPEKLPESLDAQTAKALFPLLERKQQIFLLLCVNGFSGETPELPTSAADFLEAVEWNLNSERLKP